MHAGDQSVWSLAALALALGDGGTAEQRQAATSLLGALGVDHTADFAVLDRSGVAAQAAAPLMQTTAILRGDGEVWAGQSDEALRAQG